MIKIKTIIAAKPLDIYILEVQFEDGYVGLFDCKPYLDKGVFKQLRDIDEFNAVRVAFGTIVWPCGADFDPEGVYEVCLKKTMDEVIEENIEALKELSKNDED